MCDLFLVLAQAPEGLTCFLLPRVLPDGTRNAMRIQRLKDKLGNRSNASSEVEYDGAFAWRVGEPGRGVATIIEMVSATRLDCVIGSAAAMRQACVTAVHYAGIRRSFGTVLSAHPLMASVLADLALESEAATTLAMRLAGAAGRAARGDEGEAELLRLALPAAKYWVCKRTPTVTAEALECLGGNGYVEESGMPRLYREAPLNSIWEGSGNVTALDVLRALARSPGSAEALLAEIDRAADGDQRFDVTFKRLRDELGQIAAAMKGAGEAGLEQAQYRARRLAGLIAVTLQASLLVRHAPAAVADAFCASRLGAEPAAGPAQPFGTLPDRLDLSPVLDRARVAIGG
jgi:putative acyl-CoA dehydrogenase